MLDSDIRCFKAAQLDFTSMVRRRLQILFTHRLNRSRVDQLESDNPEKALMCDLVHLPAEFVSNGRNEPIAKLRGTYLRVHTTVNCMLGDIVNQRLAFLQPKMDAIRFIKNLHLSAAHWTVKKRKPSRRPIGDLTYVAGMPLNSKATTTAVEKFFREIRHPTIGTIAAMILEFWHRGDIIEGILIFPVASHAYMFLLFLSSNVYFLCFY